MDKENKIDRQVSVEVRDEEFWNKQILKYNNRLRKKIKDNSKNKKNFSYKKVKEAEIEDECVYIFQLPS